MIAESRPCATSQYRPEPFRQETIMNQLEMLARDRIEQRIHRRDRSGVRRSARLISQEIRRSRRHADK
jgi:hypothetical protein